MVSENERAKILELIEDGTITAEEGLSLLNALGEYFMSESESGYRDVEGLSEEIEADQEKSVSRISKGLESNTSQEKLPPFPVDEELQEKQSTVKGSEFHPTPEPFESEIEVLPPKPPMPDPDDIKKWKRWWVIPFWIGAGITVIGGALMYWAYRTSGFGFWFACAWFPFLLGVAALSLAWSSRTTPWVHVRVHQAPGETPQKIAISFPIPIRLTSWGLKMFGYHIPHMEGINLDEVILALKDVAKDSTPLFVDVNEGENGEHVQVFIG